VNSFFNLTRNEQRTAIFIVLVLVVTAFTQHLLQRRSNAQPAKPLASPAVSPAVPREVRQNPDEDSR
jgi:hypothetical protein